MGVLPVPSFSGNRYFVVFVDEYTRYIFTRLLKKKSDLYEAYEEFRLETQNRNKWVYYNLPGDEDELRQLRSDNAKEYEKLGTIIKSKYGTRMRFTQVYTPQDNGIAERRMRMIMEKVRAMLYDGHHPVVLWGEAIQTATYVINITPGWRYCMNDGLE
jgi:transposase InsO family protein